MERMAMRVQGKRCLGSYVWFYLRQVHFSIFLNKRDAKHILGLGDYIHTLIRVRAPFKEDENWRMNGTPFLLISIGIFIYIYIHILNGSMWGDLGFQISYDQGEYLQKEKYIINNYKHLSILIITKIYLQYPSLPIFN